MSAQVLLECIKRVRFSNQLWKSIPGWNAPRKERILKCVKRRSHWYKKCLWEWRSHTKISMGTAFPRFPIPLHPLLFNLATGARNTALSVPSVQFMFHLLLAEINSIVGSVTVHLCIEIPLLYVLQIYLHSAVIVLCSKISFCSFSFYGSNWHYLQP